MIATMIVLVDISTAPMAGERMMPPDAFAGCTPSRFTIALRNPGSPVWPVSMSVTEPASDCLHLVDFGLLSEDDLLAKELDLHILNRRALSTQDCRAMVRYHRPQKPLVRNRRLTRVNSQKAINATTLVPIMPEFILVLSYMALIKASSKTTIEAFMRPAM